MIAALVLFGMCAALTVRTYVSVVCLDQRHNHGQEAVLLASRGRVLVFLDPVRLSDESFGLVFRPMDESFDVAEMANHPNPTTAFDFAGFGYWRTRFSRSIAFPLWAVSIAAAGVSVRCMRQTRNRVPETHVCSRCGYDLRASAGRCPECGTPISGTS